MVEINPRYSLLVWDEETGDWIPNPDYPRDDWILENTIPVIIENDPMGIVTYMLSAILGRQRIMWNSIFGGLIDLVDSEQCSLDILPFLATNLNVLISADDSESQRRSKIKNAVSSYRLKGTNDGIVALFRSLGWNIIVHPLWFHKDDPWGRTLQTRKRFREDIPVGEEGHPETNPNGTWWPDSAIWVDFVPISEFNPSSYEYRLNFLWQLFDEVKPIYVRAATLFTTKEFEETISVEDELAPAFSTVDIPDYGQIFNQYPGLRFGYHTILPVRHDGFLQDRQGLLQYMSENYVLGKPYTVNSSPSAYYPDASERKLTDGARADFGNSPPVWNPSDPNWVGWEGSSSPPPDYVEMRFNFTQRERGYAIQSLVFGLLGGHFTDDGRVIKLPSEISVKVNPRDPAYDEWQTIGVYETENGIPTRFDIQFIPPKAFLIESGQAFDLWVRFYFDPGYLGHFILIDELQVFESPAVASCHLHNPYHRHCKREQIYGSLEYFDSYPWSPPPGTPPGSPSGAYNEYNNMEEDEQADPLAIVMHPVS